MNITEEQGRRAMEISEEMIALLDEFKKLAKSVMTDSEYQNFKYNTLGHLEPGLITDHAWFTGRGSSIKSIQYVAEDMADESGINGDAEGHPDDDMDDNYEDPSPSDDDDEE